MPSSIDDLTQARPAPITRADLLDLHPDILGRIAFYLSRNDAIALALTHPACRDAAESRIYRSLDLLFYPSPRTAGDAIDPELVHHGHEPTAALREHAKKLGDPVGEEEVEYDYLQGGLRYFTRLLNARPDEDCGRRQHVREIYADCIDFDPAASRNLQASLRGDEWRTEITEDGRAHRWLVRPGQIALADVRNTEPDPALALRVLRTFQAMGVLRGVTKLTLRIHDKWEGYLRLFLAMAPNTKRLILVPMSRASADQLKPLPDLPRLRHLAIGPMRAEYEGMVTRYLRRCPRLDQLVLMDWGGVWDAQKQGAKKLLEALEKRKGVRTLFLPQVAYDHVRADRLVSVQTLGVQGTYQPSLRFSDITIPHLPRLRRLVFHLDRSSTFLPTHQKRTLPPSTDRLPPAIIPVTILEAIGTSPRLTDVHYSNPLDPLHQQHRAEIRTYSRPGETFTHVRVRSDQVVVDGQWFSIAPAPGYGWQDCDIDPLFGYDWQDWVDYRGRAVPRDVLDRLDQCGTASPGRDLPLSDKDWKVLEDWWVGEVQ